ncbi:MAG: MBL fold metallo-hydrolase [Rhodospirillaceae bacterium]
MSVTLTFHGACGIVTGSCFRLSTAAATILIDCGLFQGTKTVRALNYGPLQFDPKTIDAVLLTHAHIDHCGLSPKLVRSGYRKNIHATAATCDLLSYVLPDSGHIQEMEVERLNWRNRRRGKDAVHPIYTRKDAEATLSQLTPADYGVWFDVADGMRARYWDAGHILGSASIELSVDLPDEDSPLSLLFSGDIGPGGKVLHDDPDAPKDIDVLVMETTYGDRVRDDVSAEERRGRLGKIIGDGLEKGGLVLIPCFAVERTQELLVDLDALFDSGALPTVPLYVDSPLATRATEVFDQHLKDLTDVSGTHPFRRANVKFVRDVEESKSLARLTGGAIIMAGSGMADAGRIRHHLKNNLHRRDTTVLLVGYQAPGTMGHLLLEGRKMVRIHGDEIAVRARIELIDDYSGHADRDNLLTWLGDRLPIHNDLFLVHGEEEARLGFASIVRATYGEDFPLRMPVIGETVSLSKNKGAKTLAKRPPLIEPADTVADWHNLYADTVLTLRHTLEKAKNDKERRKILENLSSQIKAVHKSGKNN